MKYIFFFLLFPMITHASEITAWETIINSQQSYEKFVYDEDTEMYTGDIERVYMEQKAPVGKIYVLYDLTVSKKNETEEPLSSQDYALKIGDVVYPRQMDDYFLLYYHFRPLTHLEVKQGTHNGQILFEIPVSQKDLPQKLLYKQQDVNGVNKK